MWSFETRASFGSLPGAVEQSDLLQNVTVRLVENGCAAMRAFSGATEDEWLAYLAAITTSVVRETLRREIRRKRHGRATIGSEPSAESWRRAQDHMRNQHLEIEKNVLVSEVRMICERMIRNLAGAHSNRDGLIFRLYFLHGVSIKQIVACKGICLSRSGVGKVIETLVDRVRHAVNVEPVPAKNSVAIQTIDLAIPR